MLLNPKKNKYEHLDERSREIMLKTITFFENKGKKELKKDYNDRVWYSDFLDFVKHIIHLLLKMDRLFPKLKHYEFQQDQLVHHYYSY